MRTRIMNQLHGVAYIHERETEDSARPDGSRQMYSQLHANFVAYKIQAGKRRFRQIAVVEKEQFEVRIFEGDVVQREPTFIAESTDAEVYFHQNLKDAIADAEKEFKESFEDGWQAFHA